MHVGCNGILEIGFALSNGDHLHQDLGPKSIPQYLFLLVTKQLLHGIASVLLFLIRIVREHLKDIGLLVLELMIPIQVLGDSTHFLLVDEFLS